MPRQGRDACDRTLTGGIEITITGACAQAPLFAARPGARPAALVYERDDPQFRPLDNTENEIGKPPKRKAPSHRAPRRSEVWLLAQDLEGTLEFGYEREPQFGVRLFGVEKRSIGELMLGLGRDGDNHFSAARARAMASAAGTR